MAEVFYMVYVENGGGPVFKHASQQSALVEAKRLAKVTGRKTYVLKATTEVVLNEFQVTLLMENDNDIPF